ncbi:MAG TPA: hypothetical protein VFH95_05120 [Candidatus Kapabacteria bacterium]|nr:hypothetical protein [Candidatus Kapabacteria bacterium]
MKHSALFSIIFIGLFSLSVSGLRAQTEVEQHKISIDSATGKRTVTTTTIVKTVEDISPFNLLGGMYGKGTSPTIRFDLGYAW